MTAQPGDLVTSNIRLVRLLGVGGMGSVWVARHETLDVDVAVKFVSKELLSAGDPLVVERFKREAKLSAKIESQHVVRVFDHGVAADGSPYIVMELMRGEALSERIARLGRIAPEDAARIVSEVATGLASAHALGIVHRDIKPHNVFLARSRDGVELAKILDFGIAKTTAASDEVVKAVKTSTGVLIGTPQYMSPEQLMRAGPVDTSADLWALSVVAYEMVTGQWPFRGETLAATLIAITRASIEPPTSSVPEAPKALDEFFLRAFAADADRRFATATELASAFVAAAGGMAPAPIVTSDPAPTRAGSADAAHDAPTDLSTAEFLAAKSDEHTGPLSGPADEHASTRLDMSRAAHTPPTDPSAGKADVTQPSMKDDVAPRSTPGREKKEPARRGNLVAATVLGAVLLTAGVFAAVKLSSAPQAPPTTTPSSTGALAPSADAAKSSPVLASSNSAVAPVRVAASIKKQAIPDGKIDTPDSSPPRSRWVPDFWIERDAADAGKTFLQAELACRARKLALCTDAQFERACATHPEFAPDPTWTLTSESGGFVVRGGAGGCAARVVVPPDDVDVGRSANCCTRGVTLAGDLNRFGALGNPSHQIVLYENRFNAGQGDAIAKNTPGTLGYFNQTLAKDKIAEAINWVSRDLVVVEDACTLSLVPNDPENAWMASCTGLEINLAPKAKAETRASIGVLEVNQRFEYAGSGLLRDVRTWLHPRPIIDPPGQ